MHPRKRLIALCLGIALAMVAAASVLYAARGGQSREPRTSDEVARAHMTSVRAGDIPRGSVLLGAGAVSLRPHRRTRDYAALR